MQIIKQEPGFPPKRVLHGGLNLSRLALPGAETKQGHLGSGAQGQRGVHLAFGDGVDLESAVSVVCFTGRLARRRRHCQVYSTQGSGADNNFNGVGAVIGRPLNTCRVTILIK